MNRSPAFQFYPDKWQSHTRRLSDSSYRVFHELLCWMWQHAEDHCSIEASPEAVACALAMPSTTVEPALNEINNQYAPLLRKERNRWVCNGLRKEAEKQRGWREKSSNAGKASAAKRKTTTTVEPALNGRVVLEEPKPNSLSLSLSLSPNPTPLPPQAGDGGDVHLAERGQPSATASGGESQPPQVPPPPPLNPLQRRLGKLFNRRETTGWSKAEVKAFKSMPELAAEDLVSLERYYTASFPADKDYRRRDLATLLNNITGEIDRAKANGQKVQTIW